jgi:predicted metal-binding protein
MKKMIARCCSRKTGMHNKKDLKVVRKILIDIPDHLLLSDLKRYKREAIHLGATDCKIIETKNVIIDERAYAKCHYPKCQFFGTSANCPPYSLKPEETVKMINRYRYGIIFALKASASAFVGSFEVLNQRGETGAHRRKIFEIASKLEAMAFYDGYYFALGFASGPCKALFCKDLECAALVRGKACRFPLKARSAMEAVGMDVFGMALRMGWDIYPCGAGLSPADVPFGKRLGIVFIY